MQQTLWLNRVSLQNDESIAGHAIEAGAYEDAVRLLRPLAERNSEYALLTLGWIYETGAIGAPDKDAARSFYEHAASQGSATACLYLGRLLWRDAQEIEARAAFERGAQLNNDECKSDLARLVNNAEEKLADEAFKEGAYEKAIRLLRPLAERNSVFALLTLGFICETGVTGPPDWDTARSFYERAAAQGSGSANFELGRLFKGQGEEAQARAAFEAGAELGDLPSMERLGRMMVAGRGGAIDVDAGTAWLEKAAARGHIFAQRTLLGLEARKTKSLFRKVAIAVKFVALGVKGAKEMSKVPNSDKVR
jgi:TPR repeat protein